MIDDWLLSLIYAAWLAASTMPLGLMLGSSCSPCCGGCAVADGKPRTDPKDEGTWVPSGTWRGVGGVTWSFTANPGDESGETWFFYGSAATSRVGGNATFAEQQDWGNICNWYSNKTTNPSAVGGSVDLFDSLNKRATRLPPQNAVVHAYSAISTASSGPVAIKHIYFWLQNNEVLTTGSEITASAPAHDSNGGAVFRGWNNGTVNGGATFVSTGFNFQGTVNDGATFIGFTDNRGAASTVNGGAEFYDTAQNRGGTVNGGATFNDSAVNAQQFGGGTVSGTVNGGATFNDSSRNSATVNDGATFNDNSQNWNTVNNGATFNQSSRNDGTVSGGATFNDNSRNSATVNDGATFNDAACSTRTVGAPAFPPFPCTRKFVTHPTDLPICNGTAVNGCFTTPQATCGCG